MSTIAIAFIVAVLYMMIGIAVTIVFQLFFRGICPITVRGTMLAWPLVLVACSAAIIIGIASDILILLKSRVFQRILVAYCDLVGHKWKQIHCSVANGERHECQRCGASLYTSRGREEDTVADKINVRLVAGDHGPKPSYCCATPGCENHRAHPGTVLCNDCIAWLRMEDRREWYEEEAERLEMND